MFLLASARVLLVSGGTNCYNSPSGSCPRLYVLYFPTIKPAEHTNNTIRSLGEPKWAWAYQTVAVFLVCLFFSQEEPSRDVLKVKP